MKETKIKLIEELTKSGYYYVNPKITTANFPIPETVETEGYRIIELDARYSSEQCLAKIAAEGLRPATVYELAMLKESHPEALVRGKWHVALGSIMIDADGDLRVPLVYASADGDFEFNLVSWDGGWPADDCLVCFCDSQPSETQVLSDELGSFDPSECSKITKEREAIEFLKNRGFRITREKVTIEEF